MTKVLKVTITTGRTDGAVQGREYGTGPISEVSARAGP